MAGNVTAGAGLVAATGQSPALDKPSMKNYFQDSW